MPNLFKSLLRNVHQSPPLAKLRNIGPIRHKSAIISERPAYDPGKQYDAYYDGKQSIYETLYGGEIILRDKQVIFDTSLTNAGKIKPYHRQEFPMVDYGCGDGRYLKAVLPVAQHLKEKNIHAVLTAYDPSKAGLQKFEEKLQALGFLHTVHRSYQDLSEGSSDRKGYLASTYTSSDYNLTVRFVHGNVYDHPNHVAELMQPSLLTLCMFGVISHIPFRHNRVNTLTTMGNFTSEGSSIITFPGMRILTKEHEMFRRLREGKYAEYRLTEAVEAGDLYYTRTSEDSTGEKQVENFYHIYRTAWEVDEDLKRAGLTPKGGIQIQKILHETTLTQNPWLAYGDGMVSQAISRIPAITGYRFTDAVAGYYLAIAERYKELQNYPQPVSPVVSFRDRVLRERQNNSAQIAVGAG